jgi:sec-independent protein translocase protein TatA
MFGIGMPELMLIFVLALLVFGPKELPRIARTLGKAMAELRRASDELRDGIQREIELAERAEAPPPPPEAAPSTPAEGTSPAPETQASVTMGGAPSEGSETPHGTVAAEVPTEPATPAPMGQVREKTSRETVEPTVTQAPPEASEAKEAQKAPGENQSEDKTAPHAPSKPVETRNA